MTQGGSDPWILAHPSLRLPWFYHLKGLDSLNTWDLVPWFYFQRFSPLILAPTQIFTCSLHSTLYTLHSTLYSLQFIHNNQHSTLSTLDSTHIPFHTLHLHFTLFTPHFTLHTLHFTLSAPHSKLYTSHSTLYTYHKWTNPTYPMKKSRVVYHLSVTMNNDEIWFGPSGAKLGRKTWNNIYTHHPWQMNLLKKLAWKVRKKCFVGKLWHV